MIGANLVDLVETYYGLDGLSLTEISLLLKKQNYQIKKDIADINELLNNLSVEEMGIENFKLHFPLITKKHLMDKINSKYKVIYNDERQLIILIYLFIVDHFISNQHFQDLLFVSKNSVINDLKLVEKFLKPFEVSLVYSRKTGYKLEGNIEQILLSVEKALHILASHHHMHYIVKSIKQTAGKEDFYEVIKKKVISQAQESGISFIDSRIEELLLLIDLSCQSEYITSDDKKSFSIDLKQEKVSRKVEYFFNKLGEAISEITHTHDFFLVRFLGNIKGNLHESHNQPIIDATVEVIDNVRKYTGSEFRDSKRVRMNLYEHLEPAYYRIKYRLLIDNPFTEQINKEYSSLYQLINKSLRPLEKLLNKKLPPDEIAFFTIHFGGVLEAPTPSESLKSPLRSNMKSENSQLIRALVVCPNGISSSLIMTSQLNELIPHLDIRNVHQVKDLSYISSEEYDVVFSNINLEVDKPLYVIKPLMNNTEKSFLLRKLAADGIIGNENTPNIDQIISLVSKYATIHQPRKLMAELTNLFYPSTNIERKEELRLTDVLKESVIQITDAKLTWSESIEIAAKPLLDNKAITQSYIDDMIKSVKELGAYIVLAPHVAVPHARPENNVNQVALSLLSSRSPIDFNQSGEKDADKLVHLVFVLAAKDNSSHLGILQDLSKILDDDQLVNNVLNCKTPHEIWKLITETVGDE